MLDVIMSSSCRSTIIRTLESFLKNVSYSGGYNFIVNIDVLNPGYLPVLMSYLKKRGIKNIRINTDLRKFDSAFTKVVTYLYGQVKTPFFFHLEDDWVFLKKIRLDPLVQLMENHSFIDHIRFSKERIKKKAWMYHLSDKVSDEYLVPNKQMEIDGISLVQTPTWSTNPSLVRSKVVKEFTSIPENMKLEKYICNNYPRMFPYQGTYIYGKVGDPRLVLDIGRNRIRERLRKIKYILRGGKYADYLFGD